MYYKIKNLFIKLVKKLLLLLLLKCVCILNYSWRTWSASAVLSFVINRSAWLLFTIKFVQLTKTYAICHSCLHLRTHFGPSRKHRGQQDHIYKYLVCTNICNIDILHVIHTKYFTYRSFAKRVSQHQNLAFLSY